MPWLRLWTDILDDVDVHAMTLDQVGAWTLLLAAAKKHNKGGELPPMKTLAFWVHHPVATVQGWINGLVTAGFIDGNGVTYTMHGWERWQEPKDRTNAERQARFKAGVKAKKAPPAPPKEESNTERDTEGTVTQTPLPDSITPLPSPGPSRGDVWAKAADGWVADDAIEPFDPGPPPVASRPAKPIDPEVERVSVLAEELGADVAWKIWVHRAARLGSSPAWIEAAIRKAVKRNVLTIPYVETILQGFAAEGGPRSSQPGNGRPQPRPDNRRIVTATPEQRERYEREQATYKIPGRTA